MSVFAYVNFGKSLFILFIFGLSIPSVFSQQGTLRPLTPEDLFKIEEIGRVTISPDGKSVAYVLRRPKSTALIHTRPFLEGNDRGDVWLVSTSGGEPRNLTKGINSGSGWWAPVWSLDGSKLAMLSTSGGNVRLWVWEARTNRLRPLTERGVDMASAMQIPFAWLNDRQLICPVLPAGQYPNAMTVEMRAAEIAMREWPKAWRGREATANVIDSGVPSQVDKRLKAELLLIDLEKGATVMATGISFRELSVSPTRQYIAVLRQFEFVRPDSRQPLIHGRPAWNFEPMIFDSNGKAVSLSSAAANDVQPGSLRWSPDGKSFALVASSTSGKPHGVACFIGNGSCMPVADMDEPAGLFWAPEGSLMILPKSKPGNRQDWWILPPDGQKRNVTEKMKMVPRELIRETALNSVVGLADGELWRIPLEEGEVQNLTAAFEPKINAIIWPVPTHEIVTARHVIVSIRSGTGTEWHSIDLPSGEISLVPKPNSEAAFSGFSPKSRTAAITAGDRSGTFLWISQAPFKRPVTVVQSNTHLREIAQTEFKKIEYRSSDGRPLKGWVLLPTDYEPGKKFPMITVVYPGNMFGDNPPGGMARSINASHALNFHLLAARGYAVLFPSIPLKPEGEASDPLSDLTNGVLPAVDKLVELGIADPKRLGVMGQSYGGYGTYGLISQTNRFQAAVSLAGLSNLISMYGGFDPRFRYDQFPQERTFSMSIAESGQLRMGSPPWKDLDRYIRNSPIFVADRIATPVLIVHGDLDYVGIQQGEEMFTALHRQNKRVSFVRYWGEGHVIEGAANVRDLWSRIFKWFDQYLRTDYANGNK